MKRIVKLHINKAHQSKFKSMFHSNKHKIAAFDGCNHVELLQSLNGDDYFFTISIWEHEDALNNYRQSELFKGIWAKTKLLFDGPPEAWSINEVIDEI